MKKKLLKFYFVYDLCMYVLLQKYFNEIFNWWGRGGESIFYEIIFCLNAIVEQDFKMGKTT